MRWLAWRSAKKHFCALLECTECFTLSTLRIDYRILRLFWRGSVATTSYWTYVDVKKGGMFSKTAEGRGIHSHRHARWRRTGYSSYGTRA